MFSWNPNDGPPQLPRQEWIPATVDEAFVVWSGDGTLLCVRDVTAWPGHFTFVLDARWRREHVGSGGHDSWDDPRTPGRLRVGFELADGTRITGRMVGEQWAAGGEREMPSLVSQGGSGGDSYFEYAFEANFEPRAEDFAVVVEWPDRHIPLTKHRMSGSRIRAAIGRSERAFSERS